MSVDVFETTLQKTYEWLDDLMDLLDWDDQQRAYLAFKGTLHALRDRLPVDIAAKVSAQLPMLVRGFYYEGWRPAATPVKVKTPDEFLDLVLMHFNNVSLTDDNDVEEIVRAVFQVISDHISAGEVDRIRLALPLSIAELWPSMEYGEEQELMRREIKYAGRQRRY